MKNFCINTNTYHGFSLDEAITGIEKTGINQIELLAVKGWTEHVMPSMSADELDMIKKNLMIKRLIPVALDGHADIMTEEGLDSLHAGVKLAAFFECKWFLTELSHSCHESDAVNFKRMIKNVESLAEHCAQNDLSLAFETRGPTYNTGTKIMSFLDKVNSSNTFINFDAANIVYFTGENPYSDLRNCVSRVGIVHLKDKAGSSNEWNFPALGEGMLDFAKILNLLPEDVIISIDIEFTEKGPTDVFEVHNALKKSCDYLRKMGLLGVSNFGKVSK